MVYTIYGDFENSVPLNPMVNDQTIPIKWLFVWEYTLFSDKPIYGDFGDGRWHCFTTIWVSKASIEVNYYEELWTWTPIDDFIHDKTWLIHD